MKRVIDFLKEWKEYVVLGLPILFTLIGFSIESTRAKLLSFLNYELPLKTWQIIIFIISSYIILKILFKYLTIKSHEQVIKNGTQVILKTNTNPIMIASKFNHKSNEILCTWNFKGEMKEKWISQEALKEYVYTPQITVQRKSNNWLY